ncbi:hypothetical protein AB0387_19780 [Streptomyces sp. NPDC089173]|uniref:hypothetical protein n=1 Tax=Streptomyces sp. NPDC089173 TaxID=3154965 RepID=UPI00344CAE01
MQTDNTYIPAVRPVVHQQAQVGAADLPKAYHGFLQELALQRSAEPTPEEDSEEAPAAQPHTTGTFVEAVTNGKNWNG